VGRNAVQKIVLQLIIEVKEKRFKKDMLQAKKV
jgi:hypothetical protein